MQQFTTYLMIGAIYLVSSGFSRPDLKQKIDASLEKLQSDYGYQVNCNALGNLNLQQCYFGVKKLDIALKSSATQGKSFQTIYITNWFHDTDPRYQSVFIDARATQAEMRDHLASQLNKNDASQIKLRRLKVAIDKAFRDFEALSGYSVLGCITRVIDFELCLRSAENLKLSAQYLDKERREFRNIFIGDSFKDTDANRDVYVHKNGTPKQMAIHLMNQRSIRDPEFQFEESLRQAFKQIRDDILDRNRVLIVCSFPSKGLNTCLETAEVISIIMVDLAEERHLPYKTIYMGEKNEFRQNHKKLSIDTSSQFEELHRIIRNPKGIRHR